MAGRLLGVAIVLTGFVLPGCAMNERIDDTVAKILARLPSLTQSASSPRS
jgi:hypothetical protein